MKTKMFTVYLMMFAVLLLSACGPSKQLQDAQRIQQYHASQPATPNFVYKVATPFMLIGDAGATQVSSPADLEAALADRPSVVIAVVGKNVEYGEVFVKGNMRGAGYAFVGQKVKKGNLEMTFQDDSAALVAAAEAKKQQEMAVINQKVNQLQAQEAQSDSTNTMLGVTFGTMLLTTGLGFLLSQ